MVPLAWGKRPSGGDNLLERPQPGSVLCRSWGAGPVRHHHPSQDRAGASAGEGNGHRNHRVFSILVVHEHILTTRSTYHAQVRWVRLIYTDFAAFTEDQEFLISLDGRGAPGKKIMKREDKRYKGFDYVEGSVTLGHTPVSNWRSSFFSEDDSRRIASLAAQHGAMYCIEGSMYYDSSSAPTIEQVRRRQATCSALVAHCCCGLFFHHAPQRLSFCGSSGFLSDHEIMADTEIWPSP